jgi:hypothetical protein
MLWKQKYEILKQVKKNFKIHLVQKVWRWQF